MKKADIINRMAEKAGITKAQADKAIDAFLASVKEGLKHGEARLLSSDLAPSQWLSVRPGQGGIQELAKCFRYLSQRQ